MKKEVYNKDHSHILNKILQMNNLLFKMLNKI